VVVTWRLIDTGPLSGQDNMAVDEALLHHFDPVTSPPILRLYGWEPAALSIGRFQKAPDDLNLKRIKNDRLTVVRRITGGGAIYHAAELTYAIICSPRQLPPSSSIKESFRVLTSFLLSWYRELGLDASYAVDATQPGTRLGLRTPICFAGTESYDILVSGRKLGGNAQRRLKQTIFQHGSIPLEDHFAEGLPYLCGHQENKPVLITSLADEGVVVPRPELKQRLLRCFSVQLMAQLQPCCLSPAEQATARKLALGKYGAEQWNLTGEVV